MLVTTFDHALANPAFPGTRSAKLPYRVKSGEVRLEPVFDTDAGNAFIFPVWFGEIPGRPNTFLVAERGNGKAETYVYTLRKRKGEWIRDIFLTLPVRSVSALSDERGLLSLAFHPKFSKNRRYFISYTPTGQVGGPDSIVVEERFTDVTLTRDLGTPPLRILALEKSYPNHNSGSLAFGTKDGYLYIGLGDGGASGDPEGNAQNLGSYFGKILRVNVNRKGIKPPYLVPKDNPFAKPAEKYFDAEGNPVIPKPEIWAYGLRNPWRMNFDPTTGELWVADVGQNTFEEVNRVYKGSNLGWNSREGTVCFEPPEECERDSQEPVLDLGRAEARAIIGGFVYRGNPESRFDGAYIFGDFETRNLWALNPGLMSLGRLPEQPSSFGEDSKGNLYMVGFNRGVIYRMLFPGDKLPPELLNSTPDKAASTAPASAEGLPEAISEPEMNRPSRAADKKKALPKFKPWVPEGSAPEPAFAPPNETRQKKVTDEDYDEDEVPAPAPRKTPVPVKVLPANPVPKKDTVTPPWKNSEKPWKRKVDADSSSAPPSPPPAPERKWVPPD